jgi:hypothetical protein
MITIPEKSYNLCDGVTRRAVVRVGALGMGGLALLDLLSKLSDIGSDSYEID